MLPMLFPHDEMRSVQKELVELVGKCIEHKLPLIVHAPTGLGKTAATLAPAMTAAKDRDLTIFFLTSRHTQHLIAIQTLNAIKNKFGVNLGSATIVGKKHLCAQPGVLEMPSDDFSHFCKSLREESKCAYYLEARKDNGDPTKQADVLAVELKKESPAPSEHVLNRASTESMCPYELSLMLAKDAKVIIADYNYLFNPKIRDPFFAKIGKKVEQSIIIVDEGHNLPNRLREQMTQRITSITIKRALAEADKYNYPEVRDAVVRIKDILEKFATGLYRGQEKLITRAQFIDELKKIKDPEELATEFEFAGDGIREEQRSSFVGALSFFIQSWSEGEEGFSRILKVDDFRNERIITLSHRCLDPSFASKNIIDRAHCTIIMSGTLTPTAMYADVLGFPEKAIEREFPSPFPVANKRCIVVPNVTTKFSERSEGQYKNIASLCANIANAVPGCSAIFFPSYALRDSVAPHFNELCKKTVFMEDAQASKEERSSLLVRFAQYKTSGAVLLGVAAGSFGEGIDLPGVLKCVTVVGVPLDRPDLETKELINYYEKKFHKGWDYGYVLPAIAKTLQNAGRCIRSETDRGVLLFLDARYAQPSYSRCFPKDWNPLIVQNPVPLINNFFATKTL